MKIVINKCYGGFGISKDFFEAYNIEYKGSPFAEMVFPLNCEDEDFRTDKRLIDYIEKFGSNAASGPCSNLVVEEIPKGTLYRITEYDGLENIEIQNNIDWKVAT